MIITNNCLGGYIYKHNELQYDNPFIWTRIYINSFINLVKNYKDIDFQNFELLENNDLIEKYNPYIGKHQFSINLKPDIRIIFQHIKYDAAAKEPIIKRFNEFTGDIFSRYTYKIVYETYLRRLKRFDTNKKTLFVFMHDAPQFDDNEVLELLNTAEKSSQQMIFFTEDEMYKSLKFNNVTVIVIDRKNFEQIYIAKTYNDLFKDYL